MAEIHTTLQPTAGTGVYSADQTSTGAAKATPLVSLSATLIEELQQKAMKWIASPNSQQATGTPGVSDSNGAPEIEGVGKTFSADDLAEVLRLLDSKTKEAQLRTAKESIETSKLKMAENHKQIIAKIEENAKKCAEAAAAAKKKSIFGWLAKIFSFVGSIIAVAVAAIATVATGGAAAPALAISCCCLAASTMSLASAISVACGGPPLELSSILSKAVSAVLRLVGVPKETADSIGKIASGIGAIAISGGAALLIDPAFVSNIVAGGMGLGGVDPDTIAKVASWVTLGTTILVGIAAAAVTFGAGSAGAVANAVGKTASTAASTAGRITSLLQGATTVVAGGVQVGSGIAAIDEAKALYGAETAMSDKKKLDAVTIALMKTMEDESERMKKILKEIEEGMQTVSEMMSSSAHNMSDITQNMGGSRVAV